MELQEFQFSVAHKPGKLHSNADALSRLVAHDQPTENTLNTAFNSHDPAADNSNCAITLNPTINLRKAQQDDPSISKVIQMKTSHTPNPDTIRYTKYTSRSSHSGAKSFRNRNTKRHSRQSIHRALRGHTNIRSH